MQRCKAKSKRSGERCKNFAMKGWGVCRMHGAKGGPRTQKGKDKCKLSCLTHGFYTHEGIKERKLLKNLLRKDGEVI